MWRLLVQRCLAAPRGGSVVAMTSQRPSLAWVSLVGEISDLPALMPLVRESHLHNFRRTPMAGV